MGRCAADLAEARTLITDLMIHVHDLSLDLRPTMLDDLGLLPTLVWHLKRYAAQTQVQARLTHTGLEQRFPSAVETAAFRIVQEALTNIARHAGVREASVRLRVNPGVLIIEIEDHGAGFDPPAVLASGGARGLAGMRERATLLGGKLTIQSTPGAGTYLKAELPLGERIERRTERSP